MPENAMLTHMGLRIYVDPANRDIRPCLANGGYYESWVEAVLRRLLRPGQVAVEIGANHGYHTLVMAEAIGPHGRLHSFEANPAVAALLRETIAHNAFHDRVDLRVAAVGDREAEVEFDFIPDLPGGGHVSHGPAWERRISVPLVTLDSALASLPRVDVVRMDVEGYEAAVLNGAWSVIDRSPGLVIVAEWCPPFMRAHGTDIEATVAALESRGFRAWNINRVSTELEPLQLAAAGDDLLDIVIGRRDLSR